MSIMAINFLKNKNGFTLLEVLVAGAILSVGLLGIASMMATAINGNSFARKMSTAQLLAEQRIEKYRNYPVFTAGGAQNLLQDNLYCIPIGTGNATTASVTESFGTITRIKIAPVTTCIVNPDYSAFSRVTTATFLNNNMVSLTVTVSWKDTAQKTHNVTLNTLFTQ